MDATEEDVEVDGRHCTAVRDADAKLHASRSDLLLDFEVNPAHDGHVDDEYDPDEALPDSYRAGGLVRLCLPGLVDEAAPLGSQKVSRGV